MNIKKDDLTGAEVQAFIKEHLFNMTLHSPPESIHALDIEKLKQPGVTFWTAWEKGELAGMGALKELHPAHGEIKSMRTASSHLRRGVAHRMLQHIINESSDRGYTQLFLETGSQKAFHPAVQLYKKFGFIFCDPFAGYKEDPNSLFMTLKLTDTVIHSRGDRNG
ncbi:GNAT family N-acetyltransferase [Halobacillus sp. Cin3]|uniref:GNAT family N-acetyltransferase n=1 Tax=Halobacillus sp. Cin3 TaxID=2928441 RepID=UPI00248DB4F1|nr:GNAT family N-acetyltransferase [Halobacillus sp. Cin3]